MTNGTDNPPVEGVDPAGQPLSDNCSALIAIPDHDDIGGGYIINATGKLALEEIQNASEFTTDHQWTEEVPAAKGLYVWEGRILLSGIEADDPTWKGSFRPATVADLVASGFLHDDR